MAGLVVGAICFDRRQALAIGAAYGFVLGFSFIAFDYQSPDPVLTRLPFFAIIGAVSPAFGAALNLAGQWVWARLRTCPVASPARGHALEGPEEHPAPRRRNDDSRTRYRG